MQCTASFVRLWDIGIGGVSLCGSGAAMLIPPVVVAACPLIQYNFHFRPGFLFESLCFTIIYGAVSVLENHRVR